MKRTVPLLSVLFFWATTVWGFKTVNNGGDFRALEFKKIAILMGQRLPADPAVYGISGADFLAIVMKTVVESTDQELNLNGIPKDAINTRWPGWGPPPHILFNRAAWDSRTQRRDKAILVAHEYLGAMGIDDSDYARSLSMGKLAITVVTGDAAFSLYHLLDASEVNLRGDSFFDLSCRRTLVAKQDFSYGCLIFQHSKHRAPELTKTPSNPEGLFFLLTQFADACGGVNCELKARNLRCHGHPMSLQSLTCSADMETRN